MHPFNRPHIRYRQQGQTLIIALIILGVLLILGLVFLGLIDRNILNAARSQRRSEASDLAEAGVRYAHGQLVSSPLRADWRGVPSTLSSIGGNPDLTGDPDAYYLRPGYNANDPANSSGVQGDLGGPDELGSFVRVLFPGGRALVRVRYGASDASPTKLVAGGPLINPGSARSQIIIEAVGRTGRFIQNDPTTYSTTAGVQFKNFGNAAQLGAAINQLASADAQLPTSRRVVAYAPIGIIDAARFETNVFNSSEPIDLGIPEGLGAAAFNDVGYNGGSGPIGSVDVGSKLDMQLGTPGSVQVRSGVNSLNTPGQGFGSLIVNGDLLVHGRIHAYLNQTLGDIIRVSGRISGASTDAVAGGDPASLIITPTFFSGTGYTLGKDFALTEDATNGNNGTTLSDGNTPVTGSFDSQTTAFSTGNGLVYDGSPRTDTSGFPSGVGRLVPPSAETIDPQTKLNGYVAVTRESGIASTDTSGNLVGGNTGQYGHGGGIFVDNQSDRQEALDAQGRAIVGSQQSLFDDWLNPNSGAPNSGWKGPFYVPRGAAVQLLPDGLSIQRDGSAPAGEKTWKRPDGSDSGLTTIRYRFGKVGNQVYVVDTLTPNIGDINGTGLNFSLGQPFDGVLYFEGNVRVRGTIPTGVQMTLVSGATIYIDGPIVKGTTYNEVFTGGTKGNPINSLPTATLMLMARDNVAVNTTMFFGPTAAQSLESVNDTTGTAGISPVRLRAAGGDEAGSLELLADLALDPDPAPTDPSNWSPYALTYRPWDATGNKMATRLLLGATMDDGTASASFLALNVNYGSPYPSPYAFNANDGLITNTAAAYTGQGTGTMPIYGLGAEPWQRYARFEIRPFTLIDDTATSPAYGRITQTNQGYSMFSDQNDLLLRPGAVASVSANDTLIGRAAMAPADVRIEASVFAEEGSFFVIPGPWFNPNPNDTHVAYANRILELTTGGMNAAQANATAARERLEAYGTAPGVPFYGEPLDVKLNVIGSVAENLPPPASVQAEWQRKWGWIPRRESVSIDGVGPGIPKQHVPGEDPTYLSGNGSGVAARNFVPNLIIQYDPVLATGRTNVANAAPIRVDGAGRPLPPMPRLPVSPKLSYFGEL